jgi:hypothetical protein
MTFAATSSIERMVAGIAIEPCGKGSFQAVKLQSPLGPPCAVTPKATLPPAVPSSSR